MMRKVFGDYYLGLDMGTSSVGWAVTDLDYKLLKFNGKAMWGVRLFDEAKTASETRVARSARRRIAREKWRISLLQQLFADEISKLDMGFFVRQKESRLHVEDKSADNKVKYSLFDSSYMTDKEYYENYPTIYHLRRAMLENKAEAFDVRLLYLVVANFYKHRGHFLLEGIKGSVPEFHDAYLELVEWVKDNLENLEDWDGGNKTSVEDILKDSQLNVSGKKKALEKALGSDDKRIKAIAAFLSGSTGKLSDLFADDSLKESEKNSFSFKKDSYEELEPVIAKDLGEGIVIIEKLKAVYDWSLLIDIKGNHDYISYAKTELYDDHAKDLQTLKAMIADHPKEFKDRIIGFPKNSKEFKDNYSKYIGSCLLAKGKRAIIDGKCDQEALCKYLKKELSNLFAANKENADVMRLQERIEEGTAFPKQLSKANGIIPMQVNCFELEQILKNAEQHLPFLAQTDETGLSVSEKLLQIMKFRIPYYVGPLAGNAMSREKKRCWIARKKENIKITPWNFDDVVDKAECANRFIRNMTNKCSYLAGEDVVPKNSLLYSEFMARNELNCLSIAGKRLPVYVLNGLYDHFMVHGKGKISKKKIAHYFKCNNIFDVIPDEIGGIDNVLKSELKSYKDFRRIFGDGYVEKNTEQVENIIKWITVFCGEKAMLVAKIKENYPEISDDKLKLIKKLQYKDWGRLSETLLNSSKIAFVDDTTDEYITVIEAMRRNALNFMELMSSGCMYGFKEKVDEFNNDNADKAEELDYDVIDNMYVSPAVKRSLWQTVKIVKEIEHVTGHAPKRIFIEMAREEQAKQRTKSRKQKLVDLYKECKKLAPELQERVNELSDILNTYEEDKLRSDRLYLYFLQLGKCMYTGQKIEIEDIYADQNGSFRFDIDHIYPRSKTKDDSLDNRVLVYYKENRDKTDSYPLTDGIQSRMKAFWKLLREKDLISAIKYERLVRKTPLTDEELAGFINRQLVETRQSTKAAAEIFKLYYPDTELVYSKAGNVSDFRQEFELIKCRDLNDYHHAKDAFLNIVVGNAYHVRFTNNPIRFIKELKKQRKAQYTLKTKEFFDRDIVRGNDVAWIAGDDGTSALVKATMAKNNILYTRMAVENKGQLYDLNILKKNKGQVPIKKSLKIEKYGGYNKASTGHFMLIESEKKKNKKGEISKVRSIEAIPTYIASKTENILNYLKMEADLINPRILIDKILINSLLEFEGKKFRITGKTEERLTGWMDYQLVLSNKDEAYLKRVVKVASKTGYKVTPYDKITLEKNIELYKALLEKHKSNVFKNKPASQIKTLEDGLPIFVGLSLEKQCLVISEIIKLFICKSVTCNLELIGGKSKAGAFKIGKNISSLDSAYLYNQSVTGLFEQKINLLKL